MEVAPKLSSSTKASSTKAVPFCTAAGIPGTWVVMT